MSNPYKATTLHSCIKPQLGIHHTFSYFVDIPSTNKYLKCLITTQYTQVLSAALVVLSL